ncbi:MAG: hypothetical protein IPM69_16350 [Ignavibacteria bacterium]|nr:hypothetical protein [Ignavibacteria bacterium]
MKKILTVIVCFVMLYCRAYSQEDIVEIFPSIDYNFSLSNNQSGRINFYASNSKYNLWDFDFFSIATQYDGKTMRVSSNAILSTVSIGVSALTKDTGDIVSAFNIRKLFVRLPLIIQVLTNPTFKYSLYSVKKTRYATCATGYDEVDTVNSELQEKPYRNPPRNHNIDIWLLACIKTDFYLLNDVSRIYSEGKIGLRGRFDNTAIEAQLGIPLTKGYYENKNLFLGLSAYVYIYP